MTTVAIQLILIHLPENPSDDLMESEVIARNILGVSSILRDWAMQEITEGSLEAEAFEHLKGMRATPGVYSMMNMFRLIGGKSEDTPNGPGEGWSECHPIGQTAIEKLSLEEANEWMPENVQFNEQELNCLFPDRLQASLENLVLQAKDNDENAPHSQG